jgi:hypothetical protein
MQGTTEARYRGKGLHGVRCGAKGDSTVGHTDDELVLLDPPNLLHGDLAHYHRGARPARIRFLCSMVI